MVIPIVIYNILSPFIILFFMLWCKTIIKNMNNILKDKDHRHERKTT
jgi:hypothetical protein